MREPSDVNVSFDEKSIAAIFSELNQCHLPGAAVGIAVAGKPVYRKGFGLAHMELPVVLSPAIRLRIGSTTKHFAALAYLLLCEEGRASLDDPLGTHLPQLHPVTHGVTVRQLLTHTSGLRDSHDIRYQLSGTSLAVSSEELLSLYARMDDVSAAPGTRWSYNNGGYLLVSAVIERLTGEPLEVTLRKRVFEPAGMFDTELRRWDSDFVANSASLHMTRAAGGFEKPGLTIALAGEGGVVSTVDDMLLWLAHVDAPKVGTVATWASMKAPHALDNGVCTGYGLGLMSGRYRGVETLAHAGGVVGGNSQMLKVPAARLDIAVMVNRHDVSAVALTNRILDACLPSLEPVTKMASGPLATGVFRSPTTGRVIQLIARQDQQFASIDSADLPVVAEKDGTLYPAAALSYLKYSLTLEGEPSRPNAIQFVDFGRRDRLVLMDRPDNAVDIGAIAGCYQSRSTGTEMKIEPGVDGTSLRTTGLFGTVRYKLEPLADGLWRARSTCPMQWGGILSFEDGNRVLRFSTLRTAALPFRRLDR